MLRNLPDIPDTSQTPISKPLSPLKNQVELIPFGTDKDSELEEEELIETETNTNAGMFHYL